MLELHLDDDAWWAGKYMVQKSKVLKKKRVKFNYVNDWRHATETTKERADFQ